MLLRAWSNGDHAASEEVFTIVYRQLIRLARSHFRDERQGHTLSPTALVHEAYLRLVDADIPWADRSHFFATCATVMRRILVDHAKSRGRAKRGGPQPKISLEEALAVSVQPDPRILVIDESLTRLAREDERKAKAFELSYFGGLTLKETSEVLGGSVSALQRDLTFARAWVLRDLEPHQNASG